MTAFLETINSIALLFLSSNTCYKILDIAGESKYCYLPSPKALLYLGSFWPIEPINKLNLGEVFFGGLGGGVGTLNVASITPHKLKFILFLHHTHKYSTI